MDSFATFLLSEVLSTPVPWEWDEDLHDPTRHRAFFTVGEYLYRLTMSGYGKEWGVTFSRQDPHNGGLASNIDITGSGHAFTIFATLAAIVKEFLAHYQPTRLYFSGSEPSRIKLYRRLVQNISRLNPAYVNMSAEEEPNRLSGVFVVGRKGS